MAQRKQILCEYDGYRRELCAIILGHSKGEEKALTFQFGGQSKSGLPAGGEWRCLWLAKVRRVRLRDGAWFSGTRHTAPQGCVEDVDIDVNPSSPYKPKRRLFSA
jgi:hypothetical protein